MDLQLIHALEDSIRENTALLRLLQTDEEEIQQGLQGDLLKGYQQYVSAVKAETEQLQRTLVMLLQKQLAGLL